MVSHSGDGNQEKENKEVGIVKAITKRPEERSKVHKSLHLNLLQYK